MNLWLRMFNERVHGALQNAGVTPEAAVEKELAGTTDAQLAVLRESAYEFIAKIEEEQYSRVATTQPAGE